MGRPPRRAYHAARPVRCGASAPARGPCRAALRDRLVAFIHKLRDEDLFKRPGVAESIDWAHALTQLDVVTSYNFV